RLDRTPSRGWRTPARGRRRRIPRDPRRGGRLRMNRVRERAPERIARIWLSVALVLLIAGIGARQPSQATSSCESSGPGTYDVTVCITSPGEGATLTGRQSVAVTVTVSGTNPGVRRVIFTLGTAYLLTDFQAPYEFVFLTAKFVDQTQPLE